MSFEVHAGSFVGTATDQPRGERGTLLATAAGTVTSTFFPLNFVNEAVGTGNGILTSFNLDNFPIEADSEKIYVDGVLQEDTTDYTINDTTGAITFVVAPADTLLITATYKGTLTKAVGVTVGQELTLASNCTTITSTAGVVIS